MFILREFSPLLGAMAALACCSAFFSCSEAALFTLQTEDRCVLKHGHSAQRTALKLLARPDRLLTAILFWNLIINIVYFALASVVAIRLKTLSRPAEAGVFAVVSLLAIILLSEMFPKTIGVLQPRKVASLISLPLAAAVRTLDPVIPVLGATSRALQRLLIPGFRAEPYLELSDLERAISLSTEDKQLVMQEHHALQNILSLSDLAAEELMRPRTQYQSFRPPVHLEDLGGQITRSGYLLVTETDSEEISSAIPLKLLPTIPRHHLENHAQPVIYVPWCCRVADVLEQLQQQQREVAAVVNELGETIGIVTLEDLLETVFEDESSRSERLLEKVSIQSAGTNRWHVTGITSLRRLGRYFEVQLPASKSTTIAGILQEQLQRLPSVGDQVRWGQFELRVLDIKEQGGKEQGAMTVELKRVHRPADVAPWEEPTS
jgi:CBS domain containing-hemolysin-like protein